MAKQILTVCFLIISTFLMGQTEIEKVENLMSQDKISEARPILEHALLKDENNPKLLLYKGMIIHNQIEISTAYQTKQKILDSTYYFYLQAVKYDEKKVLQSVLAENLNSVAQQYSYTGMEQFNEAKYSSALKSFEKAIDISELEFINQLDTILWYNAAVTAEQLENFPKAEQYYLLIIKYNPTDWNSIVSLANIYKKQGRNKAYFSVIRKANLDNPQVLIFYKEIVGYYLERQQYDSALVYLDVLIKKDNYNDQLYFLKGSILQEKGEEEQSNVQYNKCLEINPNNVDANYNLAANIYNKALDILKKDKLNRSEKEKANQYFKQALIYLERVRRFEPDDKYVLSMLITCYQVLNMKKDEKELEQYIRALETK